MYKIFIKISKLNTIDLYNIILFLFVIIIYWKNYTIKISNIIFVYPKYLLKISLTVDIILKDNLVLATPILLLLFILEKPLDLK